MLRVGRLLVARRRKGRRLAVLRGRVQAWVRVWLRRPAGSGSGFGFGIRFGLGLGLGLGLEFGFGFGLGFGPTLILSRTLTTGQPTAQSSSMAYSPV